MWRQETSGCVRVEKKLRDVLASSVCLHQSHRWSIWANYRWDSERSASLRHLTSITFTLWFHYYSTTLNSTFLWATQVDLLPSTRQQRRRRRPPLVVTGHILYGMELQSTEWEKVDSRLICMSFKWTVTCCLFWLESLSTRWPVGHSWQWYLASRRSSSSLNYQLTEISRPGERTHTDRHRPPLAALD